MEKNSRTFAAIMQPETSLPDRKRIRQHELKRRTLFALKVVLLLVVTYGYVHYHPWLRTQETLLLRLVRMALFYLSANLLISLGRTLLVYFYLKGQDPQPKQNSVVLAINRIATLLKRGALVVAAFLLFDLTWGDFFSTFSLVAVATVLVTKDYISNVINGLVNMMSDRLSLGDHVKVNGHEGKVVNITLSNVYLVDNEDHLITIPNNTVFAADVINYGKQRAGRVAVPFELKREGGLGHWEDRLREAMRPYEQWVDPGSYELVVRELTPEKLVCSYVFTLLHPNYDLAQEISRHLLRTLAQVLPPADKADKAEVDTVRVSEAVSAER
jgi:hypothetical protein